MSIVNKGSRTGASARDRLSLQKDPLRFGLAALLVIGMGRIHQHFGFLAAVRPALLLGAGALGYALLNPGSVDTRNLFSDWPTKVMVALLALACVTAPFGLSLGASASHILFVYSREIILALFIIAAIRSSEDLFTLTWGYVVAIGVIVTFGLLVFGLEGGGGEAMRLDDLYMYDSNDIGCLMLTGLPLAILTYRHSGAWGKILSILVLVGIGGVTARSGSRATFLGLIAVGAGLLAMLRQVSLPKRVAFAGLVVSGLLVMTPPGYWDRMQTITDITEDYNWTDPYGRRAIMERGVGYMLSNPLTGVGINNFARAEGTISKRANLFGDLNDPQAPPVRWTAPHNSYVQVGAELGVLGLILWSTLVFGTPIWLLRLRRRLPPPSRATGTRSNFLYEACTYLAIAFVGFAVSSAFVSFAYLEPLYVLVGLAVGVHRVSTRHLVEHYPAGEAATEARSGSSIH